ncbi:unnamed protein product [Dovyalis caffra]|uniref:Uncharacterized protein n=1 Tax=Dovyalis caffra TaxID=77055 RepID=A0AAV1S8W8_9ROSI|nr:unnamed protein product [Dovyalis caffra]
MDITDCVSYIVGDRGSKEVNSMRVDECPSNVSIMHKINRRTQPKPKSTRWVWIFRVVSKTHYRPDPHHHHHKYQFRNYDTVDMDEDRFHHFFSTEELKKENLIMDIVIMEHILLWPRAHVTVA